MKGDTGLMRIGVTGGTGFVGQHLVRRLQLAGYEVAVLSRRTGVDLASPNIAALLHAFLRARPDGPTAYHRTKWAAEAIIRESGIPYTVLKAGVIHGRGDHMLDHLSHALSTFPVFGLVGMREHPVRPVAVDDVARILEAAATGDEGLWNRTIAVLGPDEMLLGDTVRRVADTIGRRPIYMRLPIVAHLALARLCEAVVRVPLISIAQVHILAEGVVGAAPVAERPPPDLVPTTPFSDEVIRAGLPEAGAFGCRDLRWRRA